MKINIHPGKLAAIAIMIFIYLMGLIAMSLGDTLQSTRHQLTKFYETSFNKCIITKTETLPYPSRGTYKIFYTDCQGDFYPVLLERNTDMDFKNIFKEDVFISKDSNSVNVDLLDNGRNYKIKIRHPDDEDDRGFGAKVFFTFILIAAVLILVAPNSKFDRLTKRQE